MKILKINSSSNRSTSASRLHVDKVVAKILSKNPEAEVIDRDVAYADLPFINEAMLGAMFTREEQTKEQKEAIAVSDQLTLELISADRIVIGSPMYNFTVPASLKAYFDLIARAGMTFQYTDQGPKGLLSDKKVTVVISTGTTAVGSSYDMCSPYVKLFLNFLGLTDIEIVPVEQTLFGQENAYSKADAVIEEMAV